MNATSQPIDGHQLPAWLTYAEIKQLCGLDAKTIHQGIKRGLIISRRYRTNPYSRRIRRFIERDSLLAYLEHMRRQSEQTGAPLASLEELEQLKREANGHDL